ncbi:hypothetical protein Daus18300_009281 [Diaporthe australafricana]|uniref:O-methyltransferase C-terminal domain-containing protein n=1 Tax=Diaporthe australafricana TaxID=127596 RepID=A0ABR3WEX8_9PEZI
MASRLPSEEIFSLVDRINSVSKDLDASEAAKASKARRDFLVQCKKLVGALEEPDAQVWPRAFQVNVAVSIDIAATLGIWDKLRCQMAVTVSETVKDTGVDKTIIIRILRQLTAAGLISDIPDLEDHSYILTPLGKPYLDRNHLSFNRFILRDVLPTVRDAVEQKCFPSMKPSRQPHAMWFSLVDDPNRTADMVRGMRSLSSGSLAATAYPFGDELKNLGIKDDDVAIVDIAGGQGHIMEDIRKKYPGLKGRIVVQDLQPVLDAAPNGPPEGVEFMGHDMFKPQPITTAHVYYLRHIVHDWDDDSMTLILKQLVPILIERPATKLLLADLVLPTTDISMQEAVRDFTMFRIGGLERTEDQWRRLLARSGLKIKRIWRGTEPEACVECTLVGCNGDTSVGGQTTLS